MRLRLQVANGTGDVLRCRQLIADVYNTQYGVVFSEDHYDLAAKIEPWPHRYLMGFVENELVAVCGMYTRNTYIERYGDVSDAEIAASIEEAGAEKRYVVRDRREITKLVVAPRYRYLRITPVLIGCCLARSFADLGAERPPPMTFCAVRTIRRFAERLGIRPRLLKPFPRYKIHEAYRSESNPMDSYLVLPDLDVPATFRELAIPGDYDLREISLEVA